jgi:hypothetical protein
VRRRLWRNWSKLFQAGSASARGELSAI